MSQGIRIGEMSARTGVSAHTLRYYERVGLLQVVARDSGGRRRYSEADVAWVWFLLRLRQTDMPIAQMQHYAQLRRQGEGTMRQRLELLRAHGQELAARIEQLQEHQRALAAKIAFYEAEIRRPAEQEG